jgi:glyoxylase-like metal-dependent hydrolase (beta-lactamase superfamily II)
MNVPTELQRLAHLDDAWRVSCAGSRLEAVRRAAPRLKEAIAASGKPLCVRTFDTATLPYPLKFGLQGACLLPLPVLIMRNRMQVVQWREGGKVRTLLVNPTDAERSKRAPFFSKQIAMTGKYLSGKIMTQSHGEVLASLTSIGIRPADVDYVTFDHLHVQDVRRLLGEWFPNAVLLAQKEELGIFERLHPLQHAWFIPDALAGLDPGRIVALEGDYLLGPGVAIVRTPGHTVGNHSIVVHTDSGMWTISENGVGVDNYVPEASRIPGVRRFARFYDVEVVLNGNTRENSLDQYTSMILEKLLADPCRARPEFPQHFSSSEMIAHPLAPGVAPTLAHVSITHGEVQQGNATASAAA